MKYYQKYQEFSDSKFRRMLGVNKVQFDKIYQLFKEYVDLNWTHRGRPSEFSLVDRLLLTFRYLRDYPTFVVLGNEFGISESFTNKIFNKVVKSLVKVIPLPNLKQLELDKQIIQKVIIDVSEQETERPKKSKKQIILENKSVIQTKP
jgi:Helix-turn-helix of DDE superfamily endonuclease